MIDDIMQKKTVTQRNDKDYFFFAEFVKLL